MYHFRQLKNRHTQRTLQQFIYHIAELLYILIHSILHVLKHGTLYLIMLNHLSLDYLSLN